MKIGIIGAGFTGLAAAHRLTKQGFDVTVFEAEDYPGGLAVGFKKNGWKWSLEKHYHHWFYSDFAVRNLAKETGQKYVYLPTKTSTFIDGSIYQLDSPLSLMLFNKLSLQDRIRTAAVLTYLKLTPFWKSLEKASAQQFLTKYNGQKVWETLWQPLFEKKFNNFAEEIPASWFWARIKKRSASLGYPEGGFLKFATRLDALIRQNKGRILYKTRVEKITRVDSGLEILTDKGKFEFDKVICTLPYSLFAKTVQGFPESYQQKLLSFKGIGAVNLLLVLRKSFLKNGTYWLNVNEDKFPFLAVVEHTNFMDPKNYGGKHIVYVGNYLPHDHPYYKIGEDELFNIFLPFLKKINPQFDKNWVVGLRKFTAPYAQPVIPLNYSKIMPAMATPIPGLILANIQQVYPWDRGTNYAVELGEKAARMVKSS
jgi:protoporphyrinogen oxidase